MEASCDGRACSSPEDESDKIWCLKPAAKERGWLRLYEDCEVTVGRGLNVTHQIISVTYPLMISRNHCTFKQREDGQWTVTDKESMNGVWVNGNRISPGKPHLLRQDDVIRFGVPLEGNLDEFVYVLVHRRLREVKDFLTKKVCTEACTAAAVASAAKAKQSKRKFGTDEPQPCTSLDSKSKLYRASTADKSAAWPCPKPSSRPSESERSAHAGPSRSSSSSTDSRLSSQQLAALQRYNTNLKALKEQMGTTKRQAAELEGQHHASPGRQQKMQELQEQIELLHNQLSSEQEQALQRVERTLETESVQQKADGLKKRLEEALKEYQNVIEELQHAREGFKEVLQAKDKELEVTKEEKEKERAQKEEVVTQMTKILENEMQCVICSELFIEAVTLNCAHSFCRHCIQDWRRRKDECPICREAIVSQTRSLVLDNCINSMVENLSAEMREKRLELIAERKGQAKAPTCVAAVVLRDDSSSDTDSSVYSSLEGYLLSPRFPYYIDSSESSSWSD